METVMGVDFRSTKHSVLNVCCLVTQSCPTLTSPWTVPCQASLSVGFPRQEYWSELPFPPPGDLPDPGICLVSLSFPELADGFFTTSATWEVSYLFVMTSEEGSEWG